MSNNNSLYSEGASDTQITGEFSSRITRLEKDVQIMANAVTDMTKSVTSLGANQQNMYNSLQHVGDKISKVEDKLNKATDTKTPWQTILSFIGILITIIGGLWIVTITPIKDKLQIIDTNQQTNIKALIANAEFKGEAKALVDRDRKELEYLISAVNQINKTRFTAEDALRLEQRVFDMQNKTIDLYHQCDTSEKE